MARVELKDGRPHPDMECDIEGCPGQISYSQAKKTWACDRCSWTERTQVINGK